MSNSAISRRPIEGVVVANPVQHYRDLVASRLRAAPAMTVSEYAVQYAITHEIETETARQYRITACMFERWAGQTVLLTELNELMVSAWLKWYTESVRPSTARSKRNQLLALWRAAADEYLCDPPLRRVRSARVPWEPRTAFTLDEVRRLVQTCATLPRYHPSGMRRSEWWSLAIRVAWDTGLRWGDQIALRVDSIHDDVAVVAQKKTRRPVCGRLSPGTLAILRDSLTRYPRELVCPWKASHETFNSQVRLLVKKAGVRPGTWKWLRRGGASDVEIQSPGTGMSSRHLGHAPGSRIAEVHYLDPAVIAASVKNVSPRDIGPIG